MGPTKNQFQLFNELSVCSHRKLSWISRRNPFNTHIQQPNSQRKPSSGWISPKPKWNLISALLYNLAETVPLSQNKSWKINSYLSDVFTNSTFPDHIPSHWRHGIRFQKWDLAHKPAIPARKTHECIQRPWPTPRKKTCFKTQCPDSGGRETLGFYK